MWHGLEAVLIWENQYLQMESRGENNKDAHYTYSVSYSDVLFIIHNHCR